jgi:RNA polymerase sigma-70 factor (ECF subfamily)
MLVIMELGPTEMVMRIAGGNDREAEGEFCRMMGPRIRLYGLRHLRDSQSADDLVQQVLITALETLRDGGLREPEKLASFVLGTCRMTVLNQRRGVRRRQELLDQFGLEMLAPAPSPGPRLDHEKLANCVQRLKERERAVIVMSFYDQETAGDVARFLSVSEANVRVIRHRAIHELRSCMGVAL